MGVLAPVLPQSCVFRPVFSHNMVLPQSEVYKAILPQNEAFNSLIISRQLSDCVKNIVNSPLNIGVKFFRKLMLTLTHEVKNWAGQLEFCLSVFNIF